MASTHAKTIREFLKWKKLSSDTQESDKVLAWSLLRMLEELGTDISATANPVDDILAQLTIYVGVSNHVLDRVSLALAEARKGLASGNLSQFD